MCRNTARLRDPVLPHIKHVPENVFTMLCFLRPALQESIVIVITIEALILVHVIISILIPTFINPLNVLECLRLPIINSIPHVVHIPMAVATYNKAVCVPLQHYSPSIAHTPPHPHIYPTS